MVKGTGKNTAQALLHEHVQALGGIPLDFGIVVEDKPSELSCYCYNVIYASWESVREELAT